MEPCPSPLTECEDLCQGNKRRQRRLTVDEAAACATWREITGKLLIEALMG
jgi:hypothetical protein